jgi:hypothetical protein
MYRRKGFFQKSHRPLFRVLVAAVFLMTLGLSRLYLAVCRYPVPSPLDKTIPLISLGLWFVLLYFLFREWGKGEFACLVMRLDREVREVMRGERKTVYFRDRDVWDLEKIKTHIKTSLERNRERERTYWMQKDAIHTALEKRSSSEMKALSDEFRDFFYSGGGGEET